jgi:predicted exporter
MAVSASSGLQSPGSGIWGQIQQQQAQRNADQAEQQARALQARARQAQVVADQAQENASSLKVQSSQAQGTAESARRGLVAMKSQDDMLVQLNKQVGQVVDAVATQAPVAQVEAAAPQPVTNTFGQTTGTLVNVTA